MYLLENKKFENLSYLSAVHEECTDPGGKYPVLLYLHGAGSRETDVNVLRSAASVVNAENLDVKMRIYAPQCYADTWFEIFEQLIAFAKFVYSQPTTDRGRFYLTGVSMGGYGAWQLAMTCPELFAALLPICGGGMYWNTVRLKEIPVWAFHGALDPAVYITESINMVNGVNRAGGKAKLTVYPDVEHNAWDYAYKDPEFWNWMLLQKK